MMFLIGAAVFEGDLAAVFGIQGIDPSTQQQDGVGQYSGNDRGKNQSKQNAQKENLCITGIIGTVNLALVIKQGFTSFDFPYTLTGGGSVRSTEVIGILIYNDAFKNMRFSVANAEACILFVIVAIFSITQLKLTSRGGVNG